MEDADGENAERMKRENEPPSAAYMSERSLVGRDFHYRSPRYYFRRVLRWSFFFAGMSIFSNGGASS